MSHIYRAIRGRYVKPVPFEDAGIEWIDADTYEPIFIPEKTACQHPDHWKLGPGTRNGQKLYYYTKNMYIQKYKLTDEEMKEAVEQYDMASLEMTHRIICENCAKKITK